MENSIKINTEPFRLFYWFKSVPENCLGGPWWYKDFATSLEREEYLNSYIDRFQAYAKTLALLELNVMQMYPPKEAIKYVGYYDG